jgi:hypothetical protein
MRKEESFLCLVLLESFGVDELNAFMNSWIRGEIKG